MEFSAKYLILSDLRLVLESYQGDVTLNALVSHKQMMMSDPSFDPNFNILIDVRGCSFNMDKLDLQRFLEYGRSEAKMRFQRRTALLAETPEQTAATSLLVNRAHDMPILMEVFSTETAAMRWVGLQMTSFNFISMLLAGM
ncbi:MAG: hypothetical protein LWW85_06295 [Marinilabiliales bacterium]|nr:hypothetical protein [Marinilabiliales bacterium]